MKKLLSAVLCIVMILGTVSFSAFADDATNTVSKWDGTTYTIDWYEKDKSAKEFYLNSAADLAGLAHLVNTWNVPAGSNTTNPFTGATIYLNVDVDLANFPWAPIGTASPGEKNRFYGSFNGQGHTIYNLNASDSSYAGLFGVIATYNYSQTFSNITFENATVKSSSYAGTLLARANGTVIDNVDVVGKIDISGKSFVGGVIGHSYARISNCDLNASGTIKASNWQCGGIVGAHGATKSYTSKIENCSVVGDKDNGGLSITSYNGGIGAVVGLVSLTDVETTTVDSLTAMNVVITTSNPNYGVGTIAGGYTATNSESGNVVAAKPSGDPIVPDDAEAVATYVAEIGDKYYTSIQAAVNSANVGDVIVVYPGTYTEKINIKKSVTITGDPAYGSDAALASNGSVEKPVLVLANVNNGGVEYHAANITLDNLVFFVPNDVAPANTWNVSALGFYYETIANRENLTVANCDFINESDIGMSAIAANVASYTIRNNTFSNFNTCVHSYMDGAAVDNVVISDNTYAAVKEIANLYYGAPADDKASIAVTGNKSADGSVALINIDDYAKFNDTNTTAYNAVTVTDNDAEFKLHNYNIKDFDLTTDVAPVYIYRTKAILDAIDAVDGSVPNGLIYVERDNSGAVYAEPQKWLVEGNDVKAVADDVELVFAPNTDAEFADELENSVWDIYVQSSNSEIINRLNSADFTFALTSEHAMDYEIIATNDEVAINNVDNDPNRFEFHYDGKTDVDTDTATIIRIGTVKFTGYGDFEFAVADETTNAVHATTLDDNIVISYTGNALIVNNVAEDEDGDEFVGSIDSDIVVPAKKLTVNIDFPNSVMDNEKAFQAMKLVVSGGDLEQPLTVDLGTDAAVSDLTVYNDRADVAVNVSDLYTVEIENILTVNTAYTVTVSGAGYRTARYTVTMTEDKVLNFWNNVMDNELEVEVGKTSSKVTKNFLAGDIVKDATINIYDLSAVVSYFGEGANVDNGYAKYDLNRDGKIDSKDVAYVLVSWNE